MKTKIITFMTLIVLLFGVLPTTTVGTATLDSAERIEVGDLVIIVPTNEVPFYHYWNVNDNTTVYKVHFDTMFEINDINNNSQYDQTIDTLVGQAVTPLAQMTWSLSEVVTVDDTTSFNLTGVVDGTNPNVDPDLVIQFRNHITTVNGITSLKFDVLINNYTWKSETALLVLGFKLEVSDPNFGAGPQKVQTNTSTRANFGGGYMESVSYANTGVDGSYSHQIQSQLTLGDATQFEGMDENPRIYITYQHFEGDLLHDPTLGIDAQDHTFEAGDLMVKVPTTSVPFYFFWQKDLSNTTYRVAFDTLFEVNDSNSDGIYQPDTEKLVPSSVYPLALLSWEMSAIENTTIDGIDYINFNLTGTPDNSPQTGNTLVQLRNHIKVNGTDSEVKFDVVIENYEWVKPSNETLLVLGFKITTTNEQYSDMPTMEQGEAQFGDAYMHSVQTAFANNGTETNQVQAAMSIGLGSKVDTSDTDARIYIAYSYFEGKMTHDPSLGLSSDIQDTTSDPTDTSDSSNPTDTGAETTDSTAVPWLLLPAILTTIAVPVLLRRNVRKQ